MNVTSAENALHDWALRRIDLDWEQGKLLIEVTGPHRTGSIVCSDVHAVIIPRIYPWGASISINEIRGPELIPDGYEKLVIEMQSGDEIEIIARSFSFPDT